MSELNASEEEVDVQGDEEAGEVGSHPLARRSKERREQHRGLLLYAMQDPDVRSLRLVSRALGRDESSIRYWRSSREWEERIREAGAGAQSMALARYRAECLMKASRLELEMVRPNVSIPLIAEDPAAQIRPPESVAEGRHDARLAGTPTAQATRGPPTAKAAKVNPEVEVIDRGSLLLDATIAHFARQVASSKTPLKVAARDLPFLISAKRQLLRDRAALLGEGPATGAAVEVPESYRVRAARAAGTGLFAAIADDARDVAAIFTALAQQEQADAEREERDDAAEA